MKKKQNINTQTKNEIEKLEKNNFIHEVRMEFWNSDKSLEWHCIRTSLREIVIDDDDDDDDDGVRTE